MPSRMTRRKFLSTAAGALAAGGLGGYSLWESGDLITRTLTIRLSGLPPGFDGCRVAFLADLHHGWFISRDYLASAILRTNALQPDLILLGGDYIDRYSGYIAPVMEELGKLKSPLGVFAVQGNRDIRLNRVLTSKELLRQGIRELTNKGCWLERNGSKLWLCGMDDATIGHPDVSAALKGLPPDAVAIAFSHNPDLAESLRDPRIRLMCCGHTHGGQINLPLAGPLFIPSAFGHKYAQGLVQAPVTKVFVTSGVGAAFPPFRFRCPPEIALLTLACA